MEKSSLKQKLSYAFIFLIFFSITYSVVARLPRYTIISLETSLDKTIPLIPIFILGYFLAYIFPLSAFLVAGSKKELKSTLKTFILMFLAASVIFMIFPVAIPPQQIQQQDVFSRMLLFTRSAIDNEFNAFPSFHVASALLTFLIVRRKSKFLGNLSLIPALLILLSTLFTKQHVIPDILAGIILAIISYWYYKKPEALHTESAGGIVVNKKGEVIVVNQDNVSWSLPKGHIEKGEDALSAAKREICEETGIKSLKWVKNLGSYQRYRIGKKEKEDKSNLKTITMFLFTTSQEALKPKDPRNPEARWVEKEKVAELLTHKKDKEFFLKVIKELN